MTAWAIGAAVARFPDTEEVTGSIPVSPTTLDDSRNVEENAHSFYHSDKSVPPNEYLVEAFDGMARDQLVPNLLPMDLFDENDGPMLYVHAGNR